MHRRASQPRPIHTSSPVASQPAKHVDYEVRAMRHSDVDGLYQLLAENRWNMERDYLQCVFDTDPSGLVVVVASDGKIIGKAVVCVCQCVCMSGGDEETASVTDPRGCGGLISL